MAKWKNGTKSKVSEKGVSMQKAAAISAPPDLNTFKHKLAQMMLMHHAVSTSKPKKKGSLSSADK